MQARKSFSDVFTQFYEHVRTAPNYYRINEVDEENVKLLFDYLKQYINQLFHLDSNSNESRKGEMIYNLLLKLEQYEKIFPAMRDEIEMIREEILDKEGKGIMECILSSYANDGLKGVFRVFLKEIYAENSQSKISANEKGKGKEKEKEKEKEEEKKVVKEEILKEKEVKKEVKPNFISEVVRNSNIGEREVNARAESGADYLQFKEEDNSRHKRVEAFKQIYLVLFNCQLGSHSNANKLESQNIKNRNNREIADYLNCFPQDPMTAKAWALASSHMNNLNSLSNPKLFTAIYRFTSENSGSRLGFLSRFGKKPGTFSFLNKEIGKNQTLTKSQIEQGIKKGDPLTLKISTALGTAKKGLTYKKG